MTTDMNSLNAWDRRTLELLEEAYVAAGTGRAALGRAARRPATCAPSASISPFRSTKAPNNRPGRNPLITAWLDA
jgi:hypothetical protein